MRDSRRKKMLDLRRAYLGGDHPSLYAMFEHAHPEDSRHKKVWRLRWNSIEEYHRRWNLEYEWIKKVTGMNYFTPGCGNAPAWFRRSLNQLRRAKERAALRKAEKFCDWDDFSLPVYRRNINRLWW